MKVLIIEDEPPARIKLGKLIEQFDPLIEIAGNLESVAETVEWFAKNRAPDLAFADIELLDGNVFEVFNRAKIACPIIFTTAYDQFLLEAFEKNGIAYLLKPFDFKKFAAAMEKFEFLKNNFAAAQNEFWREIRASFKSSKYKERLVIKNKGSIQIIETERIAFIRIQDEIPFAFDASGRKFPLSENLSALEKSLNPNVFFRLNRNEIVNLNFIENLKPDFHDRLVVSVRNLNVKLTSSISRTPKLRKWLES